MSDLQREAREAALAAYPPGSGRLGHGIFNGEPAREGFRERYWFEKGYLAAAAPREQEIERLRAKLASMREPLWMLREEHEREVSVLRERVAEVTEQRDAWPKYHGIASEGLMILHDRKDLQDLAGLRCGDFMANAVPHLVAEIDQLRARVAELEEWKSTVPIEDLKELNEWELGFEYPCEAAASISDWLSGQIPLPERKA